MGKAHSGQAIIETFDAVKYQFDAGVEAALGELKRTIVRTKLDQLDLRQSTIQGLQNFVIQMKSLANADQYRRLAAKAVDEKLREFDEHLAFTIRQFDTGFFDPHEPERPNVNNSINIGSMTGSAIQQSSPASPTLSASWLSPAVRE